MPDKPETTRVITNWQAMPPMFPTHGHAAAFWEQLGRVIATFRFLEEVLGKAIFAFTATRRYGPDEIEAAYESWLPQLERALTDQLWNLSESYGKAVREHPDSSCANIDELIEDIKKASALRNVICHGSWRKPNANGVSIPFFVNRQKEIFETPIDLAYLQRVQEHVAHLACSIIDTVTYMGWQFPGGGGPGTPILTRT